MTRDPALETLLRELNAYPSQEGLSVYHHDATERRVTELYGKAVDIYGSVQNLTNAQYLATGYSLTSFEGPTVNATAIPTLGMPLTAIAGLRVKF